MKKLYFLITLCVLFCTSIQAQTFTFNGINYNVIDPINLFTEVADNSSFSGAAAIEETVTDSSTSIDYTVTSIGNFAFKNSTGLTSVTIPNSVTSIGEDAFSNCIALTGVDIGNSVTSIGEDAFSNCIALTSVTIPDSITSIAINVFNNCSALTSVTIPDSVTSIGDYAFSSCSELTSVIIPDSVTSIGDFTFYGCSALTSVDIGNSVTSIETFAFQFCSALTNINIPDSVTDIGNFAFGDCSSLTSVIIGNSVTDIGIHVFFQCTALTSVTSLNPTPPSVGNSYAFDANTYAGDLYVPTGSEAAYDAATVWEDFTSIITQNFTFNDINYEITDAVNNYVQVGSNPSFSGIANIPNIVTHPTTNIDYTVTSLRDKAFVDCIALTSVTIPNSITTVMEEAFKGCTNLTSVTSLNPTPPTVDNSNAFDAVTYSGILYTLAGSQAVYDVAAVWENFGGATTLSVEQFNEIEVTIYPNPVAETLYIQLQPNNVLTSVMLHNMNGQKIAESITNILDMSSLNNGVYFVTIVTDNGTATKKIVK